MFLFLMLVACGKRGDPRPPVPVIPKAASDLVVTQRGSKVILAWSYPSLTTTGASMKNVQRVVVFRTTEELPGTPGARDPGAAKPGGADTTAPRAISLFSNVPLLTPAQFSRRKERVDAIEGANLPGATAGAKLLFEDSPPFQTRDGRPVRLTYSVVTESASARSDLSNLAAIVPVIVPSAPAALAAAAKPEGVVLTWQKAAGVLQPYVAGYNVYRRGAKEPAPVLASPVNTAPTAGESYTDVPAYGEVVYTVRAVSSPGPPLIESEPSDPVTVTFKDLVPPAAPATLNALLETGAVRLVWDPVAAPDVAGYRLYRTEGVGHGAEIQIAGTIPLAGEILTATSYVDRGADLGIAYRYGVAAVDKSGNESPKTWTEWVVVPKTP